MNVDRAFNWVRQFESEELTDAALRVLEHLQMLGRRELASSLRQFLERNSEFRSGSLVPLGEPKDSSAVLTYYAEEVGRDFALTGRYLGDAVAVGGPIVFVDDFIGSGGQSVSIVENWFGEKTVELKEERGAPLPTEMQELVRASKLAFAFTAGRRAGADALRARCRQLELEAEVDVGITDLRSVFDDGVFASEGQKSAFVDACAEVGAELLLDIKSGHDEAWAHERELGYGNYGYLVVFPYNTPTQTLTALWARGKARGVEWEPLVPRRPKR